MFLLVGEGSKCQQTSEDRAGQNFAQGLLGMQVVFLLSVALFWYMMLVAAFVKNLVGVVI